MKKVVSPILYNEEISPSYFRMGLRSPLVASEAKPGQFVMVKVSNHFDPLLRRPFSLHRIEGPLIEILYKVVGKGTEILSQRRKGEMLDLIGPLGNGFQIRGDGG